VSWCCHLIEDVVDWGLKNCGEEGVDYCFLECLLLNDLVGEVGCDVPVSWKIEEVVDFEGWMKVGCDFDCDCCLDFLYMVLGLY
jgi:hypothetical protein